MHLDVGVEGDDPQPLQESVHSTDGSGWEEQTSYLCVLDNLVSG